MILSSKGIILKVFPYSNTSIICNVFTDSHGKLTFIAKNNCTKTSDNELAVDGKTIKGSNFDKTVLYFTDGRGKRPKHYAKIYKLLRKMKIPQKLVALNIFFPI